MAHLLLRLDTNASARLRGLKPFVLQPQSVITLELPTGTFSGPVERCRGLVGKRMIRCVLEKHTVKIYNPSVARAPPNLCARCKYVVAVRVGAQHQCNPQGALQLGFAGSALAILDAQLRLVAWDWYYGMARFNLPSGGDRKRNMSWTPDPADTSTHHTWQGRHIVPYPWSPHDLRLLNVPLGRDRPGSALMAASGQCRQCKRFSVFSLVLSATADPTTGGLVNNSLRAWSVSDRNLNWPMPRRGGKTFVHPGWSVLGACCNQALFFGAPSATASGPPLLAQSWLGSVVELGIAKRRVRPTAIFTSPSDMERPLLDVTPRAGWHDAKATKPPTYQHDVGGWAGGAFRWIEPSPPTAAGAPLLSTTAHLLRLRLRVGGGVESEYLLGVGHLHRRSSHDEEAWNEAAYDKQRKGIPPRQGFRFGSEYSHYFYVLKPTAPFEIVATSAEFCVAAGAGADTCESVQMVMGVADAGDGRLLLSWGANDCEAKLGFVPIRRLEEMLVPI